MQVQQLLQIQTPSPIQALTLRPHHKVWCKRDDLLHPIISGNKWRKLQEVLQQAVLDNIQHIGSFGGAYSNHLHALGYACYVLKIKFTAIVRAHPQSPLSPMLKDLKNWGACIYFINREDYKKRSQPEYKDSLIKQLNLNLLIPEGGSNANSLGGVANIIKEAQVQYQPYFDLIVLPVASGGTMAGLINYIAEQQLPTKVLGIAVLKGEGYLERIVEQMLVENADINRKHSSNWEIVHNEMFHCGGYAKTSQALLEFQSVFLSEHGFALDRVYNAKSFFALNQLLVRDELKAFKRILILHTGGLQGDRPKNT
jgi:1-aminocyclopropane-1-carboxylate deaminase